MKLIDITCPKCKAVMKVDKSKKELTCEFCGNKILIDDNEIIRNNFRGIALAPVWC